MVRQVKDPLGLPQLCCKSQLWLGFDPPAGELPYAVNAAKKKKKKTKKQKTLVFDLLLNVIILLT